MEYRQKDHDITLGWNETNKSIIVIRKIVPIASKKVEQITRNKIEQTICKQTEISRNQDVYTPHFKAYLGNITIPSFTTPFERNTDNQISIYYTYQSTDTNPTRM